MSRFAWGPSAGLVALVCIAWGCGNDHAQKAVAVDGDNTEGAIGTRAKGELGGEGHRYAVNGPVAPWGRDTSEAASFGMIGILPQTGDAFGAGAAVGGGGGQDTPAARRMFLDPNARYATTYRPGGAALAAFDAALARGAVPASDRDLVGNFGARYAPELPDPGEAALAFQVALERSALAPAGGAVNLRIAMRSSTRSPSRAPLSVHVVLDVSGSMEGQAIDNARRATEALVNKLEPSDDFSLVTFSNDATLVVPDGPVGVRRGTIVSQIHAIAADGGTNISAGLDRGYVQAHSAAIPADAVRIVMLLSDGHANGGDTSPSSLAERSARAFQEGIQTSAFGLGTDFDASLMSAIADRGAGGYYYLADATQIAPALAYELDSRLTPVAQAVEVRVRLRPDVLPTRVFGSRELGTTEAAAVRAQEVAVDNGAAKHGGIARDRQHDAEGGMRFFMPAFAQGDRHAMMLALDVPAGVGERSIASVEVRYKDRLRHKNVTEEMPVTVRFADSEAASAATLDTSVARTAQAFAAGDAILEAAERVDHGDRAGARALLDERAELLKRAATTLHEPGLDEDGLRLAKLGLAIDGKGRVEDSLALAVLMRGSAYGYLR